MVSKNWFWEGAFYVPASNSIRKLWANRSAEQSNQQLQDLTKELMPDKMGYTKHGLELGNDFEPYMVYNKA